MGELSRVKRLFIGVALGFLLCLAIVLLGAVTVSASDIVTVSANDVNVRALPDINSLSYGKVNTGTVFARSDVRADGWSQIVYNGIWGYIKTEFLSPNVMNDPASQALADQLILLANMAAGTALPTAEVLPTTQGLLTDTTVAAAAATAVPIIPIISTEPTAAEQVVSSRSSSGAMVWIPNSGKRYHSRSSCSGMKNPTLVTVEEATARGFTPCQKCY